MEEENPFRNQIVSDEATVFETFDEDHFVYFFFQRDEDLPILLGDDRQATRFLHIKIYARPCQQIKVNFKKRLS